MINFQVRTKVSCEKEEESCDFYFVYYGINRVLEHVALETSGLSALTNKEKKNYIDYVVSGNFTLDELKANGNQVFLPFYTCSEKNEGNMIYRNEIYFLEAFLSEQKAKDAIELFKLVYEAEEYKDKEINENKKNNDLREIQSNIYMLGGKNNVEFGDEEKEIYFLDEKGEEKSIAKQWTLSSKFYENKYIPKVVGSFFYDVDMYSCKVMDLTSATKLKMK